MLRFITNVEGWQGCQSPRRILRVLPCFETYNILWDIQQFFLAHTLSFDGLSIVHFLKRLAFGFCMCSLYSISVRKRVGDADVETLHSQYNNPSR